MCFNLFYVKTFLLFFCLPLYGGSLTPEEKKFIADHCPPNSVIKNLDAIFSHLPQELVSLLAGQTQEKTNAELVKLFKKNGFTVHGLWFSKKNINTSNRKRRAILTHKNIPNYFLKIGFDPTRPFLVLARVVVADLVNEIITKYALYQFGLVEKKVYHRPKMPPDFNDFNYIVLSPLISGHKLTEQEYTDFFKIFINSQEFFTLKSIFNKKLDPLNNPLIILDFHKLNFIANNDKKFFLIDTEPIFEITTPPFAQNLSDIKNRVIKNLSYQFSDLQNQKPSDQYNNL